MYMATELGLPPFLLWVRAAAVLGKGSGQVLGQPAAGGSVGALVGSIPAAAASAVALTGDEDVPPTTIVQLCRRPAARRCMLSRATWHRVRAARGSDQSTSGQWLRSGTSKPRCPRLCTPMAGRGVP